MADAAAALIVFVMLCASLAVGQFVRPRLPETHRTRETVETMQLIVTMLVTFAAVVLGLLTASAKTSYDNAAHDRLEYALQLTQLDQCLRNYGPETAPIRQLVGGYTAGVIASTWPLEPRPTGIGYPNPEDMPLVGADATLAQLIVQADAGMRRLKPADAYQSGILADCIDDYRQVLKGRLAVIEAVAASISVPFYRMLVFWLMIIFASFGLIAPRNRLATLAIVLGAISLSSAIFVISDLSQPYGGFFSIGSTDMRTALAEMLARK